VKRALALLLIALFPAISWGEGAPEWIVASATARAQSGGRLELIVVAPAEAALPEQLSVRVRSGADERQTQARAMEPANGRQRLYALSLPPGMAGPLTVDLAGRASSVLVILAEAPAPDVVDTLAGARAAAREAEQAEPPLSQNDPMYFVLGARDGYSARFQLSFKYRLFDQSAGLGREQPWLAGFYFGYTQNSLWDLSAQSRPFRDTNYRPSLFWKWERSDEKTWLDGFRVGLEHESNGREAERSRSINTLFVRPEWRWAFRDGAKLEFTPKVYGYLDKSDNPDIDRYRGYVDWRLRYDSGENWIATGVARLSPEGKGSFLLDLSRRARDLKFGPIGGYLHFQFFTGYGEDILDYNMRRKTQLRIGFAIVP
jgi:outer membrane phospholipase A